MLAHCSTATAFYCSPVNAAFNPARCARETHRLSSYRTMTAAPSREMQRSESPGDCDGCALVRLAQTIQWRGWGVIRSFSSNYALYGDVMPPRVMETLGGISRTAVEIYSIDEAFLVVEDWTAAQLEGLRGAKFGNGFYRWTGIPVGVGIGARQRCSPKLANRAAKKSGGVCVLDHDLSRKARALLDAWPVARTFGASPRRSGTDRLAALGIRTAGRTRPRSAREPSVAAPAFRALWANGSPWNCNGVSCLPLETYSTGPAKTSAVSRSFGHSVEDL